MLYPTEGGSAHSSPGKAVAGHACHATRMTAGFGEGGLWACSMQESFSATRAGADGVVVAEPGRDGCWASAAGSDCHCRRAAASRAPRNDGGGPVAHGNWLSPHLVGVDKIWRGGWGHGQSR